MNSKIPAYFDLSNSKPIVVRASKLLITINPDDVVLKSYIEKYLIF